MPGLAGAKLKLAGGWTGEAPLYGTPGDLNPYRDASDGSHVARTAAAQARFGGVDDLLRRVHEELVSADERSDTASRTVSVDRSATVSDEEDVLIPNHRALTVRRPCTPTTRRDLPRPTGSARHLSR